MNEEKNIYNDEYLPYINKWGKITNWLGVLFSFGPALVLAVVFNIIPPTLGMAMSIIVNIIILAICVFAGTAILSKMPESIVSALNYLLPALFGAIFVQFAIKKLKLAPIALCIALILTLAVNSGVFSFLPGKPTYIVTLGAVFGTIAISTIMYKKKML